jgi:hypothetical protein
MKIIKPYYEILTDISDGGIKELQFIEQAARTCYKSEDKITQDGESAKRLVKQLIDSGAWVDVTQGMDARLLNEENIKQINCLKVKMLHFAWDNPKDKLCKEALARFAKLNQLDSRRRRVYVLTNYWSTLDEDLYRVYWLRDNGYDPYVMVYDKDNAPKKIRQLQRWVNNKFIFHSCDRFEEYQA